MWATTPWKGSRRWWLYSRRVVGARRVRTDYRPSTRSRPGRSGAHHHGFALAAVLTLGTFNGILQAGGPPPVVVDSIEPAEIVQGQVPQPEIKVFGSNFIEGFPSKTNRPTVTLRQKGKGGAEFSAMAWVNLAGTVATVPADLINLLQAPLGVYDVIVTRPTDNASATLKGAFTVTDGEPEPGEIALMVRSTWGGPVNDVEIVGDLAYAAIGRRLVILDVADPANPFEIGSMNIMSGVEGVAVTGNYAFLAAHKPYRFTVADVSDPTNPTLLSAGSGGQFLQDAELYGKLAYVRATNGGQLDVFDITDPQQLVPLGGLPIGDVDAMSIVDNLLYVRTSSPYQLKIFDLASDPLNPVLLGLVYGGGLDTTAIAVDGNYVVWTTVVFGAGTSTLWLADVSDPVAPVIVGAYSPNGQNHLLDVAFSGGYAYVADATAGSTGTGTPSQWVFAEGLMVFDIATDPTNPALVATFKTHGDVMGVDVVGNRAYLHDAGEGIIILDISNPTKPVRLGNYHSPAVLRQMEKVDDLLYVADAWNGFTVLDVSDAAHPEVVSVYLAEHVEAFDPCADMSYPLGVDAYGIDIKNNTVYLAAGHLGLEVIDVTNPVEPAFLGALRIDQLPPAVPKSRFVGVRVWGDVASIGFKWRSCCCIGGFFLNLDVTEPTNIFELGRVLHGVVPATRIELNDSGFAFVGHGASGFAGNHDLVIDTSSPASPTVIYDGVIPAVADVALTNDDTHLYLASDETVLEGVSGLYIQDVTDPSSPTLLSHVNESYWLGDGVELNDAFAVAVQGQRVYVIGRGCSSSCGIEAIYLFNVADPGAPVLLDVVPYVGGTRSGVFVDEPDVFVANGSLGGAQAGLVLLELVGLNPVGDLDGDGSVGVSDLLILLGSWGPCPPKGDCRADLNDDGNVGVADLLILLANWG